MNKAELIAKLRECVEWDEETAHLHADSALLEFIGDKEITRAFDNIKKWYA